MSRDRAGRTAELAVASTGGIDVELSMSSAGAKGAVIAELRGRGFAASTGPVLLGFPFTVEVRDVDDADVPVVEGLALAVDEEVELISAVAAVVRDPQRPLARWSLTT